MQKTITHKLFSLALLLFFSTISFRAAEISEEKYEIYSAAINGAYATRSNKISVLIRNYTVNDPDKMSLKHSYHKQYSIFLAPLSLETVESYIKENEKEEVLEKEFDLKITSALIKKSDIQRLFKSGVASGETDEWDNFRKEFPDVRNVIGLSPIGYNAEKSQALVYMEEWCGFLCGMGYYIFLEKENGKWKFTRYFSPWVS